MGCGDIANLNVLGYLNSQDAEIVAVSDTVRYLKILMGRIYINIL
ncbi:MAG: hypothetical protein ACFFG0_36310 [Candidatus Thorarchaeota archaeon]